jgi:hypothetical protein
MNTGSHGFGIGDYMNNFGIKYRQGVITLSALDTIYVNNGGISSAITIDFSSMQRGTIANLALPTNDYDAANKKYVDDKVGSGSGTPTGNFLDLDSQNRQYFYESFDVFVPDVFRVVGDNYDGTGT